MAVRAQLYLSLHCACLGGDVPMRPTLGTRSRTFVYCVALPAQILHFAHPHDPPHAVGDGLDEVRQRIRQYGLRCGGGGGGGSSRGRLAWLCLAASPRFPQPLIPYDPSDGVPRCLSYLPASTLPNATRPEEEKLISLLRELQADERRYLKWFEEAEAKGAGRLRVDSHRQLPTCPPTRLRLPTCLQLSLCPPACHRIFFTLSAGFASRGFPFKRPS